MQTLAIYEYSQRVAVSVFLSPYNTISIQQTGQRGCQHVLNVHADTKGVRQSPTMSEDIVTNTDSSMLVTAGGIICQERAGKNVDMGGPREIIRERILQRDQYLCKNHRRQKIAKKATSVDHIIPKAHGGTDDDSNLESLCWECHRAKTARERIR